MVRHAAASFRFAWLASTRAHALVACPAPIASACMHAVCLRIAASLEHSCSGETRLVLLAHHELKSVKLLIFFWKNAKQHITKGLV